MQKGKVTSSLFYKFVECFAAKGASFVISVVLARLLSPDDFGLLAILTVFINISQILIQSGLNSALVQSKEVDSRDYSTVFYISLALAVVLVAGLFFLAPTIASFYNNDAIILPLRVYAFSLIFGAFNSIQMAKMQREMHFKGMMYANIIATVLSGGVGIAMAYMDMGLWALVAYNFARIVFSCIAMFAFCRWLPSLKFSLQRAKELLRYGWKILFSSLLSTVYADIRSLIIGKKYSTNDLGYYNRGQQVPNTVTSSVDAAVQGVMFPAMASKQDDKAEVKALLKKSICINALILVPMMAGLAVVAESFVSVVYTDKWLPSVFFLQVICIAEMFLPISSANLTAIKALGRSDIYMKLEIIRRLAMLVVLIGSIVCFKTVEAIAVGYAISLWLDFMIVSIPIKKLLGYGFFAQLKDTWKVFLSTIIMVIVTHLVSLVNMPNIWMLIVQVIVGALTYVAMITILREDNFVYVLNMVKSKLTRKKSEDKSADS